ncbi:hypothetical protein SteCoe_6401 [Stentor coeruleus]|uniref:Acyltransferase 3 domain-containing protein n=1 Tax=Stentor coeruleus TaxID=5963 RepID=A0A1R2CQ57_9CILI|nr:hypothetical protein SteCoe_6401 [Stentor coeruleus]
MISIFLILLGQALARKMGLQCELEWGKIIYSATNQPFSSNYSSMFQYSGFKLNYLGNYDSCNNLPGAKYVLIGYSSIPIIVQSFCGPDICTEEDYKDAAHLLGETNAPYEVYFPKSYQEEKYGTYSKSAVLMISLMSVLAFICLAASIYDFLEKSERDHPIATLILSFSVLSNIQKLLSSRSKEKTGDTNLDFLNSIRVMSIFWVILGHTYIFNLLYNPLQNIDTAFGGISESQYILVYGSFYAVDTFFWLSGFLMAYIFLTDLEGSLTMNPSKILKVYIHRYLRITPVYMFCLFFFWTLQEYLGNGPLYIGIEDYFFPECKEYWWTNMLYLNNLIPDGKGNGCFGIGWYLAVDMQLSLLTPIIIFLYARVKKVIGWVMISFFCAIGCISSGIVALKYDLNVSAFAYHGRDEYMSYYYTKPYTRVAPYVLGIACGIILYSSKITKERGNVYDVVAEIIEKFQKHFLGRLFTLIFGLGLINILIFSQYDTYKYPGANFAFTHWSKKANYFFIAMERLTFGIGLSCVVMPMILGYFKFIRDLLSGCVWNTLARLTFSAYLVHSNIIAVITRSERDAITYRANNNIRDTVFYAFISFALAFFIAILVEMPLGNLESVLRKRLDVRVTHLLWTDNNSEKSKDNI